MNTFFSYFPPAPLATLSYQTLEGAFFLERSELLDRVQNVFIAVSACFAFVESKLFVGALYQTFFVDWNNPDFSAAISFLALATVAFTAYAVTTMIRSYLQIIGPEEEVKKEGYALKGKISWHVPFSFAAREYITVFRLICNIALIFLSTCPYIYAVIAGLQIYNLSKTFYWQWIQYEQDFSNFTKITKELTGYTFTIVIKDFKGNILCISSFGRDEKGKINQIVIDHNQVKYRVNVNQTVDTNGKDVLVLYTKNQKDQELSQYHFDLPKKDESRVWEFPSEEGISFRHIVSPTPIYETQYKHLLHERLLGIKVRYTYPLLHPLLAQQDCAVFCDHNESPPNIIACSNHNLHLGCLLSIIQSKVDTWGNQWDLDVKMSKPPTCYLRDGFPEYVYYSFQVNKELLPSCPCCRTCNPLATLSINTQDRDLPTRWSEASIVWV